MRAYSQDFRDRVLPALERGDRPSAIARHLEVSRTWIDEVKNRLERTGTRTGLRIGGCRVSRLPLMVWTALSIDSQDDARVTLNKQFQITSRVSNFGEMDHDTGSEWEWSAWAEYRFSKALSAVTQYHSEDGIGGGLRLRF